MDSEKVHFCNACYHELTQICESPYTQCSECLSYSLISTSSADKENKNYFNEQFKNHSLNNSKLRNLIYRIISRIDFKLHNQSEIDCEAYFKNAKSICEIGFGAGDHLNKRLNQGFNIHGVDLSTTAVKNFQSNYPEFKDSVSENSKIPDNTDLVYSDALLEHIESPKTFLEEIYKKTNHSGIIIMRFPMIANHIQDSSEHNDINFWKPCHRTILSETGIKKLLGLANFTIVKSNTINTFAYRVLNIFLEKGYRNTHIHRNTNATSIDHPNFIAYLNILFRAMLKKSRSIETTVIAKKN